jgi:hypothetical protein
VDHARASASAPPHADLSTRLRARQAEIEQAVLARIYAVSDPAAVGDPEYGVGLKEAVGAAIAFAIEGIDVDRRESFSVPERLLTQASAAARHGVSLETVLRRYSAGYTLLGDFLICEAEESALPISRVELKGALRSVSAVFDAILTSVSEAYTREADRRLPSSGRRRVERVRKLLEGEPVDTTELGYQFDDWHLGAVATGTGASHSMRQIAATLDRNLLLIDQDDETVWAWFGGRHGFDPGELDQYLSSAWRGGAVLAIGEPAQGVAGWRLTHKQAMAALPIALRGNQDQVRYVDVALLASILQDDLLATSLHQLYLAPLEQERDGGRVARETLRAYFAAEQNVSSAAAALGVKRHTVTNRLRHIEERLERPLGTCVPELSAVLQLRDLDQHHSLAGS